MRQYGANKRPKTNSEKLLFESRTKYLNELKKTGGGITPKKWQAEVSRLTAQKNVLYEKMKTMHEELKTVETLRKNTEQLVKEEQQPRKEQKHER